MSGQFVVVYRVQYTERLFLYYEPAILSTKIDVIIDFQSFNDILSIIFSNFTFRFLIHAYTP